MENGHLTQQLTKSLTSKDNTRYSWSYDKGVQTGDDGIVGSIGTQKRIVYEETPMRNSEGFTLAD